MALVDVVAGRRRRPRRACCGSPASLEDASEHPIARAIADGARAARPRPRRRSRGSPARQGLGVTGVVDGHGVVVGRERLLADWSLHLDDDAARGPGRRRGRRAHRRARRLGRRGPRACSSSPTPSSRRAPTAIAELRALGLRPVLLTGDNRRGRRGRRRRGRHRARRRRRRGAARRTRSPSCARLQDDGARRGDGRRRRQRRRRARPGRPRAGHGHRHRRRHRGQRPHARARRPARRRRRHPPVPAHARARSRATCSGRSPTTSPPSRSPPPACSTRCSPARRWPLSSVFVVTNSLRLRTFRGRAEALIPGGSHGHHRARRPDRPLHRLPAEHRGEPRGRRRRRRAASSTSTPSGSPSTTTATPSICRRSPRRSRRPATRCREAAGGTGRPRG